MWYALTFLSFSLDPWLLFFSFTGTTPRSTWLHMLTQRAIVPDEEDMRDYEVLREAWAGVESAGRGLTR